MRVNSSKIIRLIEELAPLSYAEPWDSVGFQLGNKDAAIDKIMVALEITEAVAKEAEEKSVDLLIVHHPLIFHPLKRVTDDDAAGRTLRRLIKANIHVYVAHTNLDKASGGMNDILAQALGLHAVNYLYEDGASVLDGEAPGIGRYGKLEHPCSLRALIQQVKSAVKADALRLVGEPEALVRSVALCTGAGSGLMKAAHRMGCEVLITGDLKHHEARDAEALGIAVIDAGHFETEALGMSALAEWLKTKVEEKDYALSVIVSETLETPFKTM